MTLQPHQQRVVDEKKELDAKLTKLSAFISSENFHSIVDDANEIYNLHNQERFMLGYSRVLGERIAAFK